MPKDQTLNVFDCPHLDGHNHKCLNLHNVLTSGVAACKGCPKVPTHDGQPLLRIRVAPPWRTPAQAGARAAFAGVLGGGYFDRDELTMLIGGGYEFKEAWTPSGGEVRMFTSKTLTEDQYVGVLRYINDRIPSTLEVRHGCA
jgi:hypothetical protein